MARLICAGLAVVDIPLKPVDRNIFDMDGLELEQIRMNTGGDAFNTTINLAKLGMNNDVKFVGLVGEDNYGDFILKIVREKGLNISGIGVSGEANTSISFILIESSGERHFIYNSGVSRVIDDEYVISQIDEDTEFLHIGSLMIHPNLEYEHLERLFKYARERGISTSFDVTDDPKGEWFERIRAGLPYTDTFFASYYEAVALSGGLKDPEAISEYFRKYGIKNFVLKLGKKGCYATDYNSVYRVETYEECPVIDTTGAGDAFVSGYLFGLMRGFSMQECCVLGNASGSMSVGAIGATAATGTLEQIKQFLREHGTKSIVESDAFLAKL
ncbi:MAG: carbohydrate kinase family protein [Flexilinea sp.]